MLKISAAGGTRALLASAVLGLAFLAPVAHASDRPSETAMKHLKKGFGAAMQSKTIQEFNTALADMQAETTKSAQITLDHKPAVWKEGIQALSDSLAKVKTVADKGDLVAAKAALKDVAAVRDSYHKKMKD